MLEVEMISGMAEWALMSDQHISVDRQPVRNGSDKRDYLAEIRDRQPVIRLQRKDLTEACSCGRKTDCSVVPDQIRPGILFHEFPSRIFSYHAIGFRLVAGRSDAILVCSSHVVG